MRTRSLFANRIAIACAVVALSAGSASAQAWHYPTLQTPDISTRDFSFLVAGGGDYGTSAVAQWREGLAPDVMVNFDVGVATPTDNTMFLAGAGLGYSLMKATQETPIDLILTGGLYGAFGDMSFVRIPVGVVVGHHFPARGRHGSHAVRVAAPVRGYLRELVRLRAQRLPSAHTGTDLKLNFDIGASLDVTKTIGIRAALTIGGVSDGNSQTAFGIGLVYRPNMAPRR